MKAELRLYLFTENHSKRKLGPPRPPAASGLKLWHGTQSSAAKVTTPE